MASMMNEQNPFANMHGDVLNQTPTSDDQRERLVVELKSRGNKAFGARRMEEANILYSRAIELDGSMHALYGNRSAVYHTMGKFSESLTDAEAAIKCSPGWAKGFFRKGNALMGLKRPHAAVFAFETSLNLEGKKNKAVEKALKKARALGEKISKEEEEAAAVKAEASSSSPTVSSASTAKAATSDSARAIQRKSEKLGGEDVIVEDVSESEKIRGYKTTKDGKTTSFFHRDIDDEAKKLIGSIAPKKITTPVEPKVAPASGAGSAWNNGGTYEEKNMDKWAKGRLKELLDGSTVSLFKKYSLKITDVKKLEGEAQVLVLRGKKRFMFEFNVELRWCAVNEDGNASHSGSIVYPDLSTDACGDYEVSVKFDNQSSMDGDLVQDIKGVDGSFQTSIRALVGQFEREAISKA